MDQEQAQGLPEMWAVVGLFGHQKAAGKVTTQNLGAACLIRIDTPAYKKRIAQWVSVEGGFARKRTIVEVEVSAHSRFIGVFAIYDLNPCSEAVVMALLQSSQIDPPPIDQYELDTVKQLPAASEPFGLTPENDDPEEDQN